MARKTTTYKDMLEIIIRQLEEAELPGIPCYRCKKILTVEDVRAKPTEPNAIQKEHLHEMGLQGPDIPENCRLSHNECHKIITNGNGATTAGSSKHKIRKTDRLEKKRLVNQGAKAKPKATQKKQETKGGGLKQSKWKRTVEGKTVLRKKKRKWL